MLHKGKVMMSYFFGINLLFPPWSNQIHLAMYFPSCAHLAGTFDHLWVFKEICVILENLNVGCF